MKPDWAIHLYVCTIILVLALFICCYLLTNEISDAAEELEQFTGHSKKKGGSGM
jgi:hypothetical protein